MIQVLLDITPILVNIASFLCGLLLGHWLKLGIVRRAEFNSSVQPIRCLLLDNRFVKKELITELESKIGRRARKIVSVYNNDYCPSQQLPTIQREVDEFGDPVEPIGQSTLDKNKQTQQRAKKNC
ncbi:MULTISPECIES: hypothetical protein [unclassified Pseudoalteromonas]|uniref:hypothetical protein n=1 Tax=unclassified Pseudoalteromonas TaxID=194690 RepID=UPI001F2BFC65|nr:MULTISPECIES: hypothetical protein [unclassified Pseudoalteromonas]MCF2825809.1 hypothetical protein [Pseudoalteromonas sp. OF5H-5]MCF2830822.1 hypothetical protein [Pseudoalteromonas sp. DL2-H6]MCF2923631.1 hypothetical protein [Pseudoalteromonas sp. DL2-H1]